MRGKKSRLFMCGMLAACMLIEQIATDTMTLRTYAASDTAVESQVQDSGGSDDGSLQVYTEDSGIQAVESEGESSGQVEDKSSDTAGGTGQDTSSSDAGQKDSSETTSGDAAGQDTGKTEDASQGGSSDSSASGSGSQDAADTSSGKTDETGGTSSSDGKSTASSSAATGKSESTGEDSSRPLTDEEKAAKEKEEKEKAEKEKKEAALKDTEKKTQKADIKVIWEDDSNLYEQRPSSLRVEIADQEIELSVSDSDNETTTTVEYDSEEEATEVTVLDTISNYDTSCEKESDGVFVIRNTYKGSKKEVTININWINTLNRAEDWPSGVGSVTVKLKKNDDVKFDQVTFDSSTKSVTRNVLGDFDASNIDAPSRSGYSCVIESDDAKSNFTINYIANNRKIVITAIWNNCPSADLKPATFSVKYGEGEHVYSETFNASAPGDQLTCIKLPDGVLVADTLDVDPVSGFGIEVVQDDRDGYFVKFTYDGKGTINVSVNWVDFDDQWRDRPKDIDIYFSKKTVDGAEQVGYTISADKDWKDSTISNRYLSLEWSINAEEVKNYICTVSKFGKDSYTITYRHNRVKDCNIKVEWSGDEEHRDRRPNYVNIDILNNGNADDVFWSTQLSGNNDIASCQVPEGFDKNWIQPENVDYYVPFIYINDKEQYVIRYTYTENKAHLKVSWEDYNNVYNSRPESIRVKVPFQEESGGATQYYLELTKDDQTEDNVWEKDYWYWDNTEPTKLTVDDSKLGSYTSSGISSVTATGGINYFLTLTYDALRRQDIVFDVEWKNDGGVTSQRPDYIYVDISNNGEFLQTVKVSGTRATTVSVPTTVNVKDVVLENPQPEDPDKNYDYQLTYAGYNQEDGKLHYKIECESNGEQNEFSVEKKWIDEGHETERPESISVQLYADGKAQRKYITLSESNGWKDKFTNLPKLKSGEYTVKEVLPDEYEGKYKCEIKGDTVNTGYTITNTYIDHIPVKVIWNDDYKDSMSAFVRPDSFTMKIWLVNPVSSVVFKISKPDLVNGNTWECTIEDPYNQIREYYDSTKKLQLSDLYNYDVSYTFDKETGFVITCKNKYDYDQESISIKTEFEGDEGFESQRPDKIELIFSASGRADNWLRINREGPNVVFLPSNIFDKLTIKASNPQPSDITNADRYTYYVTKDGVALYTVHCVYSPFKFTVEKKWEDTGHKDERPSSVQVQVYVDDKKMEGDNYVLTLNGANDWKGTFRLPELTDGKTYKVKEVIPENYEDNYVSEVTGDTKKGFTITNTYAVKKTIKITKKWEDIGHEAERPSSVTVRLYDGTTLVKDDIVLSADNSWTTTVKVANNSASYHVEEVSVQTDTGTITVPDDEDAAPPAGTTTSAGTSTENQSAAPTAGTTAGGSAFHYNVTYSSYTPTTTGTEEGYSEEFIITNTYKGSSDDYRDITITKLWDDNDNAAGKRPSSVKVKLLKQVGTEEAAEVCTVTLNEDNDWKTVVRAQAKYEGTGATRQEITYSVQEIQDETPAPTPTPTPEGGTTGGETEDKDAAPTPDSSTTTGADTTDQEAAPTPGGTTTDTDTGNQDAAPTPGGTTDEGAAPTPTPSTYTGTGTGVLYIPYYSGTAETGFTITNSYNLANTNIKVVWDDAGHEDVRPKQVTEIHLYKYSEDGNDTDICGEISLDESVGWAAQVTNLYLDGTYYVAAPNLENYEKTIVGDVLDGFTITYIYRDDSDKTADIIIKKKWDMGDLAIALTHPDKATVQLKKNGEVIATQELSADNNWTFTMREQPLKDEKGEEIKYEVSEVNTPSGYEATVEESTQDTTGTDTSGQTTVTENATAETGSNAGASGNTTSGGDTSTSGNTGSGDGTGSAGDTGSGGGASYSWGSATAPAKVFTVTNKYNGRTIHYKVEKKWDIDIENNDRPDSIRVAIQKKNGDKWETVKVQSLGKDNGNSWTWEGNLPDGEYRARELKEDTLFDEFKQTISDVTKDTYTGWIAQLKASGKSYWSGLPDYLKNAADSGYDSLCDALNAKADDLHAKMMDYLGIASANDKIVDAGDDVYVDYHVPERTSVIEAGTQDAHVTHYKVTYKDSSDSCTITNEAVLEIDVIKRWIELNGAEAPDSVWVVLMMKPKASFMNNLPSGVLDYEFPVINPIKGGNNPLALIADFTVGFGSDLLNKISSSILPKLAIAKVSKDDNWKTTFVVSKYTLGIPMEFKGAEVTSEIVRQIVKYFLKIDLPVSYNPIDGFISIPTKAIHTILGVESISDITDISGLAEKAMEKVKSMKMSDFGNLGFDTLLDAWHLMANVINIKFKIDWPDPDPDPVPNTIQGKKIWDDNNNEAKKRPEQVVVHLYKNGEAAKDENGNEITATISEKSSWRYVFTDCPDKDENGNPITYTVKEDPVEGYEVTYSGYNITNKYTGKTTTEEYSDIKITKVWDDVGHESERPDGVKVTLAGKAGVMSISLDLDVEEANQWTYTVEGMPLVYDGDEVAYTLTEKPLENYDTVISGSAVNGFIITNIYKGTDEGTIDIPVTKVWEDCGQEDKRPSQITVTLKNKDTGKAVGTVNLSAANDWKAVFRAQPKEKDGKEITYTVEESAENDGLKKYESAVSGSAAEGFTISNTYKLEAGKVDVKITKQWEDLGHEDKRPAKIKATLKNADKTVATVELSESNNWTAIVRSVQLKDALGKEIEYTVEEEALENYDTAINGSAKDGFVITNAYDDQDPDTIDIPITKVWDDDNNAAGARPDSVKVALKNNGKVIATATLNEANDWTAVVRDQPIKDAQGNTIKYVVTEDPVAAYTNKVAGDALNGFTVTNRYVIQKITITKEWKGDEEHTSTRPDSVNVKLIPDGHEDSAINVQLNADNNWKETVRVPVTNDDGEEIQYTVKEEAVKDYETVCGEAVKTGNGYSFTITNTYKPETKDLKITKIWKDEGNTENRPDEIKVYLKANGETVDTITMKADGGSAEQAAAESENGEGQPAPAAENASSNTWTYTVTGKPVRDEKGKAITYTVEEDKTGEKIKKYSTKVEGDAEIGFTITNTYDAVDITITKKWEDVGQEKNRPSAVTAKLTGSNGESKEVTLNAANNWTATVSGMHLTDGDGQKITYKVEEKLTGGSAEDTEKFKKYTSEVTGDAESGFTITNTYDEKDANKIDILIRKEWKDDDDAAGKRPASVKVALKKEGSEEKIVEAELSEENNWQVTVQDQPKNDDSGKEIKYVVTEGTVENYDTQISALEKAEGKDNLYTCTVTNTYDPNEQKITVTKDWKDEGHTDRRPDGVVIKLKANDIIAKTIWLSEDNEWTATYRMPVTMTGEDGKPVEITYTIEENPVEDYEATYGEAEKTDDSTKLTVTNTYQQEKKKVKITKVWKDEGYESKRPEKVKIDLKANDKMVASIILPDGQVTYADDGKSGSEDKKDGGSEDADPDGAAKNEAGDGQDAGSTDKNTWIGYIENLPVRDEQGKEIVYTAEEDKTVDEDKIKDYKTEVSGDAESGFTITNTYEKKITFHVEKEWDIDLEKNDCPDSIKVALQKKDGDNWKTAQVVELKKDDGWKADVELPEGKYRARELKEDTVYDTFVQTIDDVTKETYSDWIKKIKEGGKSYWSSLPESIQSAANKGYDKLCDALGAKGSELREKMIGMLGASDADAKIISGEDKDCYVNYSVPERTSLYAGTQEAHKTRYKVSYKDEDNSCTIKNQAILEIDVIKRWIVPDGTELPESVWLVLMTKPSSDFSKVLPEGVLDYEFPVINPIAGGMNPLSMILEATVGVGSDLIAKITDKLLPSLAVAKVTKDDNWKATFVVSKYTMGIPMEFKGAEATSEIIRQIVKYFLHFDLPVSVNLLDGYISIPTKAISTIAGIENVSDLLDFSKLAGAALEKVKSLTMDDLKNLGLNTIMDVGHLMANVINIKFKIPGTDPDPDPDTIRGTKIWDDDNNKAGKRPETVTVQLYKNGEPAKDSKGNNITATTSAKANWGYTFVNCPSKDADGNKITYSVRETPVPDGYEATYSGYNVTNKYTGQDENPEKINITITKVWDDEGQEDKRPKSIKANLMADGKLQKEVELTSDNNWTVKVTGLALKNDKGEEIKYTVEEVTSEGSLDNYEIKISGDAAGGFTITNTFKDNKKKHIDIPIKKVWVDNDNAAGKRPESVKVTLKNVTAGEDVKTVELFEANDWQTTVTDLPQYDESGTEIEYAVEEEAVTGYTTTYSGSAAEGFTVTNEYGSRKITVIKEWKGDEEHQESRPESVSVTLKADGETYASFDLSKSNNWKVTMHVPTIKEDGSEIKYSAEEVSVKDYETKVGEVQKTDDGYSITITNTYKPETGNIKITKIWKDEGYENVRPTEIKVRLLKGKETVQEITMSAENKSNSEGTEWSTTLQNIPLRDEKGQAIAYTVEEDKTEEKIQKYGTKVEGDAEKGFTITNTYGEQQITVTKKWEDIGHEKERPENISLKLMANGAFKQDITLSAAEGWTKTITGLPAVDADQKVITYTVEEDKNANGDKLKKYKTSGVEGDMEHGFTITNTYDDEDPSTINILLKKVWEDNDDAAKKRPQSIEVTLKNKGTGEEIAKVTLSEENSWQAIVRDQPAKDDDGKDVEYQVEEVKTEGYTTTIGEMEKTEDGYSFTITNKYEEEGDKKITIIKKWKGDEQEQSQEDQKQEDLTQDEQDKQEQESQDQKNQRPKNVTVRLKANDVVINTFVLDEENNWQASIRVPMKDEDGNEYTYTVTEDPVENYETEITGPEETEEGYTFTVTNSSKDETTKINVTKVWKDEGHTDKRPEKVKIDLKANGTVVKSMILTKDGGTVTDAQTEDKSEAAGTNTSQPASEGSAVSKTDAAVNQAALALEDAAEGGNTGSEDQGEQSGSEGTDSDEQTAAEKWTGTFENMPVRDENGEVITYTVEEDKNVEAEKIRYYKTEVTGDAQSGFTVTNTYGDKATFHVEKEWKIDLEDSDRPDKIRVAIQKKDGDNWKTEQVVELNSDNGWKLDVEILDGEGTYRAREMRQDNALEEIVSKIDAVTKDNYSSWIENIKSSGKEYWSSLPDSVRSAADQGYDQLCDKLGAQGEELRTKMISLLGAKDADSKIVLGEGEGKDSKSDSDSKNDTDSKKEESTDNKPGYVIYSVPARTTAIAGEQEAHQTKYKVSYKDEKNSSKITNEAILEIDVIKRWIVPDDKDLPDSVWLVLMAKPGSKFTENLPSGVLDYEFPVINPLEGGNDPVSIISQMTLGISMDWVHSVLKVPTLAIAKVTKEDDWKVKFVVSKYTYGIPMEYKGAELSSEVIRQIIKYLSGFDIPVSINLLDGYISIPTKAIKTIAGIENVSDLLDFSKLAGAALEKAKSLTLDDLKNLGIGTIMDAGHLMANVINIKFKIPPGDPTPVDIEGIKTWDDNNNAAGKRPETITVHLYKNGQPAKDDNGNEITATTSAKANWKYIFTDCPAKDDNGEAIKYSVREDPVPEEYEVTYSGYNITNKYTGKEENPEKISIPVVKKWVDQGQEDKRPDSITVILRADGAEKATATLSASNDWSYTFEDLPLKKEGSDTEIKYEVEEKDKEAIEKQGYESVVSGNMNAGFTITNTYNHTDPDTIDIPVTKVWDDVGHEEERPSKITVKLMKEGSAEPVKTVELSKENDWKTTIYGLPKKEDGKDIVYRLEEDTESLNLQKYDTKITGDMNTGFTITNTYEDKDPLTIDIPIKKVWDDGENAANARPDSVKVTLVNRTSGKQVVTVELSEANNWSTVVRDQPQYDESGKEIVYAVSEDTVPGYDVAVKGSATEGFTVTNSMAMQKIKVLKKWEGDNDNTGTRPKSVSVTVQADGEMYAKFDLTAENNWTTTLQAPVKNKKGEEIKYTVTEETVNDYVTKVSEAEKTEEGYTFTITNTYKPETMDIRITKVWVDDSDEAKIRPGNVVIRLIADDKDKHEWELQLPKGEVKISDGVDSPARTESVTVEKSADDNQWSALLRDLPVRNEKGETITYTVEESKDGWTTEQQKYATEYSGNAKSGFTVTNTLNGQEPEKIKIPVIKIWEDNDNAAGLRPKSVKIEIINKATEEVVDTVELTAANNAANEWKGTSIELPKTDDQGKDIEYAAKELTVEGYTTEGPTGNAQIGFTFTNKYADRKVVIKKVWAGDEERIDQRPKEVLVRLMANDITARTIILNADNNWEASYRVPLKGADGTAYTYSVTEDKVEDYKTEITSDTTEEGSTTVTTFTVTNTYEQEKKDIKVTKIWKDEGFESDRPSKVKIDLKANDKVVASISLPDGEVTKVEEESGSASDGSSEPADKKTDTEETAKENTPATDAAVNTAALTAEDGTAGGKDDTASGSGSASEGSGTESTETKASTEWTGTFENMPMRDKDGKEIQYSVTEDKTVEKDKIEKYETEYGGDAESGFTVTNSRNNTFTVTKEWDIDLLGNDCPDSIRVAIQKKEDDNWKTVKVVELTKADGWKMDVKVPEGTYRAREMQEDTALDEIVAKIEDVTKQTYGKWITSIKESGKEYWSGLPESIRSAADKGYDELCDALGAKGDDLTAKMKEMLGVAGADSKIVQAGDDSYVSYHVPQRGTEEAHQTKYKVTYKDEDSSCTIKNQAVLEIDVIKRWLELNGAQKPSKVVIVLMASLDQSKIAGLDTSGITLPEYAKVEFPVVNPIKGGNNFLGVLADYSLGFGSDLISAITGFVPELAVAKVDESVNWRHSFVVSKYLYGLPLKYKGAEMTSEIIRQVVKYFTGFDSPVSFSPFGGFISIPTKAIHTILGIEDLEDITDLSKLAGKALEKAKTLTLDDFKNFGFDTLKDDWHLMANVINILFKIDIPPGDPDVPPNVVAGKKTWDDNDNAAGKRPETITVHLYKNGQPAVDKNGNEITATTSAAGEWRYSFTDCPPKDANGNKITYSVREDYVEWYTTIYDGMNVTNRYREDGGHEEKIDITITKKWEDNDNAAKKRPTTIKVNLKNGDLVVASAELSESNNWTQTIKDLPLKDAQGKEIDYKVEEVSVPGYTTVIEGNKTVGFTITNTYEEEVSNPIKIVIITKWVDEGHEDKRPDHVTIGLYADGDKVRGADQTASQEWTTVYENMPKFKKDSGRLRVGAAMLTAGIQGQSNLIQYSVTEDPVKNYTTVVGSAEEMDYGYRFIIVNTYTEEPDHGEYVPPTEPTVPTDPDEGHLVPPNDPTTPTIPTTPTTPKTPTPPTSTTPPGGTTEVGSLQVSKAVKGSAEDKAKSFTFTVTLSLNGVPYVGTVGTEGVIFDAEGKTTFTLKDGETKLIEGIPAGLQYTVTEEKADGFKVVKTGETGTIETGQVRSAQFTNVHLTGMVTSLVPKTGDTSNAILWICLIGAAVIVMLLVAVIGRKKKDQQDKK